MRKSPKTAEVLRSPRLWGFIAALGIAATSYAVWHETGRATAAYNQDLVLQDKPRQRSAQTDAGTLPVPKTRVEQELETEYDQDIAIGGGSLVADAIFTVVLIGAARQSSAFGKFVVRRQAAAIRRETGSVGDAIAELNELLDAGKDPTSGAPEDIVDWVYPPQLPEPGESA